MSSRPLAISSATDGVDLESSGSSYKPSSKRPCCPRGKCCACCACCTQRVCACWCCWWLLVLIGLGVFGYVGYTNNFWLTPPDVTFDPRTGIQIESRPTWEPDTRGGSFAAKAIVTLGFHNPNPLEASVATAKAEAYYVPKQPRRLPALCCDEYYLGLVTVNGPIHIKPNATTMVPLRADIHYRPLQGAFMSADLARECDIIGDRVVGLKLALHDMLALISPIAIPVPNFNISFDVPCPL